MAPLTVRTVSELPTSTVDGDKLVIAGAKGTVVAATTENKTEFEMPPPGAKFVTVMSEVAGVSNSGARSSIKSCVIEEKIVVRSTPFTCALDEVINPVPKILMVKPEFPSVTELGVIEDIKGVGFAGTDVTENVWVLDVPPPTVSCTATKILEDAAAISLAVIDAVT